MFTTILFIITLFIAFIDYCVLRVSSEQDQDISDQMQIEFLENLQKKKN